jgi:hypothetical protein
MEFAITFLIQIGDNLSKAGSSWGCVSALDSQGRMIWIADTHRDDGRRFIVHADENSARFWNSNHRLSGHGAMQDEPLHFSLDGVSEFSAVSHRAKSVGRLPEELHLTLFPQG